MDLHEARQISVTGVPFFMFDRKYAVSGARPARFLWKRLRGLWRSGKERNENKRFPQHPFRIALREKIFITA